MTTAKDLTLKLDSAELKKKIVEKLKTSNIAEVFEEDGLWETANVKFELLVTPKSPTGDKDVREVIEKAFSSRICFEYCYPCPGYPPSAGACWVITNCNLH